jgi:hypothetical protein
MCCWLGRSTAGRCWARLKAEVADWQAVYNIYACTIKTELTCVTHNMGDIIKAVVDLYHGRNRHIS